MYVNTFAVYPFLLPFVLLCLPFIPDLYRSCIYIAVRTNYSKYAYSVCIFVQAGTLDVLNNLP